MHPGLVAIGAVGVIVGLGLGTIHAFDLRPCGKGMSAATGECSGPDTLLVFGLVVLSFTAIVQLFVLLERRGVIRITGRP